MFPAVVSDFTKATGGSRPQRRFRLCDVAIIGHDLAIASLSFIISLYLRLGEDLWPRLEALVPAWLLFAGVFAVVFWSSGISNSIWRYTSVKDLIALTRAVTLVILIFVLVTFLVTRLEDVPRSTMIINWFVLLSFLSAPRIAVRLWNDGGWRRVIGSKAGGGAIPLLLVGTDDAAELFIREVGRHYEPRYDILGLIDENGRKIGRRIHGVPVLGQVADLPDIIDQFVRKGIAPERLILSHPFHRDIMENLLGVAEASKIKLGILPRLTDFKKGQGDVFDVRAIDIEDLLGREQSQLDHDAMRRQINNRRVLVTGAGGSIGSELSRQLAAYAPSHMTLVDSAETLLYEIDLEISELYPGLSRTSILADIRNFEKIDQIMAEEKPSLVFHAAALKHVPLIESNKIEGVLTNAIGTRNVADACINAQVKAMVMVSTDKAVNPTSTMGAAKRLAEAYCQALSEANCHLNGAKSSKEVDSRCNLYPRFITVRFGNVLGSSGSVVPLFKRQLSKGGPITITHPDMRRYFMTITEAVQLVLQSLSLGLEDSDYEKGGIYVLKMGKPVKIMDLAHQMIRLAGLIPGEDVQITVNGVRAGEKLNEELFHDTEILRPTAHPSVELAEPRHGDIETLRRYMDMLAKACKSFDETEVNKLLLQIVPEFQSAEALQAAKPIQLAESIQAIHAAE